MHYVRDKAQGVVHLGAVSPSCKCITSITCLQDHYHLSWNTASFLRELRMFIVTRAEGDVEGVSLLPWECVARGENIETNLTDT